MKEFVFWAIGGTFMFSFGFFLGYVHGRRVEAFYHFKLRMLEKKWSPK
jgi:hypothetical protein